MSPIDLLGALAVVLVFWFVMLVGTLYVFRQFFRSL